MQLARWLFYYIILVSLDFFFHLISKHLKNKIKIICVRSNLSFFFSKEKKNIWFVYGLGVASWKLGFFLAIYLNIFLDNKTKIYFSFILKPKPKRVFQFKLAKASPANLEPNDLKLILDVSPID